MLITTPKRTPAGTEKQNPWVYAIVKTAATAKAVATGVHPGIDETERRKAE